MTVTFTGLYLLAAMIQVGSLLKLANKLVNLLWSKGTVYILGQLALRTFSQEKMKYTFYDKKVWGPSGTAMPICFLAAKN